MAYQVIPPYRHAVRLALRDNHTRYTTRTALTHVEIQRLNLQATQDPQGAVRARAGTIRRRSVSALLPLVEQLSAKLREQGAGVHQAADAEQVASILAGMLGDSPRHVVMISSPLLTETQVKDILSLQGHRVDTVDVAGAILEASEEPPSHPLVPLAHMDVRDIVHAVAQKWERPHIQSTGAIVKRISQRAHVLCREADVAVLSAHFAVAESGSLLVLDEEGSRVLSVGLAPHVILLIGIEQVLPAWEDVEDIIQAFTYSRVSEHWPNVLVLPAGDKDTQRIDVILVDNGRSSLLKSEFADVLACIHCGACALTCPMFRETGGQVYGTPYMGPVGALLSSFLSPPKAEESWSFSCTLCGACALACPVDIHLPQLLARKRLTSGAMPSTRWYEALWRWWLDASGVRIRVLQTMWNMLGGGRKGMRVLGRWWPFPAPRPLLEVWQERTK